MAASRCALLLHRMTGCSVLVAFQGGGDVKRPQTTSTTPETSLPG